MKRVFAVLLVFTLLICTFSIQVSAKNTNEKNNDIEIIINGEVSEETKAKIEKYFENGEPDKDGITTYGLTCTLLGHKIECTSISTIQHKVSATVPRCLKKTYDYEECTRCDYEKSTLIASEYIFCCA